MNVLTFGVSSPSSCWYGRLTHRACVIILNIFHLWLHLRIQLFFFKYGSCDDWPFLHTHGALRYNVNDMTAILLLLQSYPISSMDTFDRLHMELCFFILPRKLSMFSVNFFM